MTGFSGRTRQVIAPCPAFIGLKDLSYSVAALAVRRWRSGLSTFHIKVKRVRDQTAIRGWFRFKLKHPHWKYEIRMRASGSTSRRELPNSEGLDI